jgi:Tfp pilus assembly protein PilF
LPEREKMEAEEAPKEPEEVEPEPEAIYQMASIKDSPLAHYFKALIHKKRKQYEDAERFFKRAAELAPKDILILLQFANFLKECKKDFEAAEQFYQR